MDQFIVAGEFPGGGLDILTSVGTWEAARAVAIAQRRKCYVFGMVASFGAPNDSAQLDNPSCRVGVEDRPS